MTPNQYWLKRGAHYRDETRLDAPFYRAQERAVAGLVAERNPRSVLEVGCNYGRITRVLRGALSPEVSIAACDLSAEAIEAADVAGVSFFVHDLCSKVALPKADLCVAIEVFLHHPLDRVQWFVAQILCACPVLIHEFDPAVSPGDMVAPHCYAHDYPAMYEALGLRAEVEVIGQHAFFIVS